jgi:hypothetical protein
MLPGRFTAAAIPLKPMKKNPNVPTASTTRRTLSTG